MLTHKSKIVLSITGVSTTIITVILMSLAPVVATALSPILVTLIGAGSIATALLAIEECQQ